MDLSPEKHGVNQLKVNCRHKKTVNISSPFQTADEPHYFGGVLSFERPQVAIAIFFPFTLP
ncbi:hypothetical protein, partial [Yersinia enterocolitica]|uniref:hypothetical protein n=1 Tax=Yersinia enterocolitica TaxID=630 RepID=UPI00338DD5F1